MYNAQVALFNARQTALPRSSGGLDIRIKAELAKIEAFKAQVEAEVAKGQLNEQRVNAYKAQVESVLAVVEIYKAQMQGASVQSDVIRSKMKRTKPTYKRTQNGSTPTRSASTRMTRRLRAKLRRPLS